MQFAPPLLHEILSLLQYLDPQQQQERQDQMQLLQAQTGNTNATAEMTRTRTPLEAALLGAQTNEAGQRTNTSASEQGWYNQKTQHEKAMEPLLEARTQAETGQAKALADHTNSETATQNFNLARMGQMNPSFIPALAHYAPDVANLLSTITQGQDKGLDYAANLAARAKVQQAAPRLLQDVLKASTSNQQ